MLLFWKLWPPLIEYCKFWPEATTVIVPSEMPQFVGFDAFACEIVGLAFETNVTGFCA